MKVAIIGYGWVGKSMYKLFPDAFVYSPGVCKNSAGIWIEGHPLGSWNKLYGKQLKKEANDCDVAFVSVPTPNFKAPPGASLSPTRPGNNDGKGELDTTIVDEVVSWCKCDLIVIRSTVNPGDCDEWAKEYKKNIIMQPEYLGETVNHPLIDPKARKFLIIGGKPKDRIKLIELYTTCYNANITIKQVSTLEAEVIKLSENRAIAFKVAQCQELYDACEITGVDYYTIRDAVYGDDPRFNLWWTFVYPKKRGFKSKCIPKDVYAWCAWAESVGYEPEITKDLLKRNEEWIKK